MVWLGQPESSWYNGDEGRAQERERAGRGFFEGHQVTKMKRIKLRRLTKVGGGRWVVDGGGAPSERRRHGRRSRAAEEETRGRRRRREGGEEFSAKMRGGGGEREIIRFLVKNQRKTRVSGVGKVYVT